MMLLSSLPVPAYPQERLGPSSTTVSLRFSTSSFVRGFGSPKMSNTEGSGKLLNYMALAQPVVAYDSPVHREYLGDLGVYAPSGDVDAFTQCVADLLHDSQRRQFLGQQLRQRAIREYTWRRAGEKIVSIYRQLTK